MSRRKKHGTPGAFVLQKGYAFVRKEKSKTDPTKTKVYYVSDARMASKFRFDTAAERFRDENGIDRRFKPVLVGEPPKASIAQY